MKRKSRETMNDIVELWEIVGKGLGCSTIEDDDFQGLLAWKDATSGEIVAMSSRNSTEINRWITMPSMARFPYLKELDLHKNRYIRQLDESICDLSSLETLILSRCEKLVSLPEQIGKLKNLREVGLICS
jgi:hypothetical protein